MIDEPKGSSERNETQQAEYSFPVVANTTLGSAPTATSQQNKQYPSDTTKASKDVMRLLKAVLKPIRFLGGFLDRHDGSVSAVATVAIVVLTGVYVRYSKLQWQAIGDSNSISRDSLVASQRAYVSFHQTLQQSRAATPDGKHVAVWEFSPVLENSGTSPTRSASHHVSFLPLAAPMPENFKFRDVVGAGDPTIVPFAIGPRAIMTGARVQIDAGVINLVKQHQLHLYFWGWISYRDIFPKTPVHVTMFCSELVEVRGNPL